MANKAEESESEPLDLVNEEEEGGGPIKSFLEHLEDLRWMLVRSVVAILVAMLLCLIGGNKLVAILMWPLKQAASLGRIDHQIPVVVGTNVLARLSASDLHLIPSNVPPRTILRFVPVVDGTNGYLGLRLEQGDGSIPDVNTPAIKNYGPLGGVMVALKLALYGGLILASPFVLYFVGSFVLPALKLKEKKLLYQVVGFGTVLFFIGVAFCYFIVAGVAVVASVEFSKWMGFGADEWRAEEYITFMCRFMLGLGLAFELPVVVLTIVKIGLLDYKQLARFRSYAVVINLVIAAFVTPSGDPFTMMILAIPLQMLYEISVAIAWYWSEPDRAKARGRLALIIVGVILALVGLWAAFHYGWPIIREKWL
jgi:sec-independent protein translocase protein TatC